MGRLLFLTFIAVPLIEIALFVLLGDLVGVVPVLLGVLVTALLGSFIIRRQGLSLLLEIRQLTAQGRMPARQMAEGVMLAVAGALLLTPGYFTDTIGFLLLVPPIRQWLYAYLASKITVVEVGAGARGAAQTRRPGSQGPDVIDLDEDEWQRRP